MLNMQDCERIQGDTRAQELVSRFESSPPIDGDHFSPSFQPLKIICPLLHHLSPLGQVLRSVVGAPVRIANCMGQLVFILISTKPQYFIQDSSSHSTESVSAHFILADPHTTHCCQNGARSLVVRCCALPGIQNALTCEGL